QRGATHPLAGARALTNGCCRRAPFSGQWAASPTRGGTPMRTLRLLIPCLLTVLAIGILPGEENKPIAGIGPAGEVVKAHTGFKFTEGPAHDAEGNVYFSDIPNNRIHKVDTEGKLTTFLEDTQGCNGLMFDSKGRLIACQGGAGKIIAIDVKTKKIT